jgi:hypothetical protein
VLRRRAPTVRDGAHPADASAYWVGTSHQLRADIRLDARMVKVSVSIVFIGVLQVYLAGLQESKRLQDDYHVYWLLFAFS